jgi:hypothetical protein
MTDYLTMAINKLNIEPGQVLSHAIESDRISLVIDLGIKGCPKKTLMLSDLIHVPEQPYQVSPRIISDP